MVKGRRLTLVGVAVAMGAGYHVVERLTDVWPAIVVFLVGGYAAGRVCPGGWALASGPVAGSLTAMASDLLGYADNGPFDLSLAAYALIGLVTGFVAVPTAALGTRVSRSRLASAESS